MSTSSRFNEKSRELCITTSLACFIGQVTKYTTVKWLIVKTPVFVENVIIVKLFSWS